MEAHIYVLGLVTIWTNRGIVGGEFAKRQKLPLWKEG